VSLDRRTLLRAGGIVAATSVIPMTTGSTAPATTRGKHAADRPRPSAAITTRNPLVEQRADPFVTRPVDGMYYMTGSVPEYDRVVIRGATTLDGLATARERTIWRRPASGSMGGYIWAPELHRVGDRWYVYFAAGDSDDPFRIRTYVLESIGADPRSTGWLPPKRMVTGWDSFTLDATTFSHRGRRYFLWAQSEPGIATNSNLYIAEMVSPLELVTPVVRIAVPTLSWEIQGFRVNEGPAVLVRNGRVFVTFSASATDARYCMGLMYADENANLLDARSWTKAPDPIFTTNTETRQFGPGHNSFTVAEDGTTDVLVYHARDYRDINGDPLFDPNRHTRVQKLFWNADGTPSFGVPVGKGETRRTSSCGTPSSGCGSRATSVRSPTRGSGSRRGTSALARCRSSRSTSRTVTCAPATGCCASSSSWSPTSTAPSRVLSGCPGSPIARPCHCGC